MMTPKGKRSSERRRAELRARNKKIISWGLAFVALAAAASIIITLLPGGNEHEALAKCLTKSGAVMYGTEWCHNCQEQKRLFGKSFKEVAYINCDQNPTACENAGVTGYPTWIINEKKLVGTQSLYNLAHTTGCELE